MSNRSSSSPVFELSYGPSTVNYLWGNPDVNRNKFLLLVIGIGQILAVFIIWVMWGIGLIQSIRPYPFYCGMYYLVYVPAWIINIFSSDARSKLLFFFGMWVAFLVLVVTSFVFGLILYDVIACALGSLPVNCRDTYITDIIVLVITAILEVFAIIAFLAYFAIYARIRKSTSVKGITVRQTSNYS